MSEADTPSRTKKAAPLDVAGMLNQAREQFTAERDKVLAERKQFDDRLAEIDAELAKIEAYFNPPAVATVEPKPARKPRAPTGPRDSGVRDRIAAKFAEYPDGVKVSDLIEAMGGKADKKIGGQVRNALKPLTDAGKITQLSKGIYKAA